MARRTQPLRWRTLQDVADVLLATTTAPEGHTLAEAMERIRRHRDRETEIFTATTDGSAKDRQTYDTNLAEFDRLLASAMAGVRRAMKKDAEAGRWIAFGRRHHDAPEEAIPPYYWPFLDIDMEEDSAKGHDLLFRGIRCLLAEEIPADHPILEQIRPKEVAGPVADEPPVEDEPSANQAPATPPPSSITLYSGTQGRPSSVETLIIPELRRRAAAGVMESSLARECLHLSQWLHAIHPTAHQIKPTSLENSLRQLYRELKSTPTKH